MSLKHGKLWPIAALALLAGAAGAAAQQGADTTRALQVDQLLGANADLPKPDAPPPTFVWNVPPLPPWLVAQPYRQQPLFATVPVGGTATGGRVRPGSGP
jgi:hypothetical protein